MSKYLSQMQALIGLNCLVKFRFIWSCNFFQLSFFFAFWMRDFQCVPLCKQDFQLFSYTSCVPLGKSLLWCWCDMHARNVTRRKSSVPWMLIVFVTISVTNCRCAMQTSKSYSVGLRFDFKYSLMNYSRISHMWLRPTNLGRVR